MPLPAAAVLVLAVALSGCSQVQAQMEGAERPVTDAGPSGGSLLETVEWGEVNGLLSVLVRNTSDRVLRRAEAVVSVSDADGDALSTSAGTTAQGDCCTAVQVPPGGTFGFYFYAGDTSEVDDVEVTYRNVQWADSGSTGAQEVTVTPVNLFDNAEGSVVSADVAVQGGPVDRAIVQAVVDGPDGELEAVISGTWFCFTPGQPRRIWMQIFTPLPEGSTVRSITAFPTPNGRVGGDANVAFNCDPDAVPQGGTPTGPTGETGPASSATGSAGS